MSKKKEGRVAPERTHIHAELTEVRQPICRDPVKRIWIVNRVHDTNDVGLSNFGLEVGSILWTGFVQFGSEDVKRPLGAV